MRIVFLGTPDFAVASLRALVDAGHEVVGVVTATDKLGGRGGKQLLESAVKRFARERDLPVLQPRNLKARSFLADLRALRADLQVVVAFRMLPRLVWDMPPLGTINVHGSLLPAYRGAAPIHWAVINGETETGVTVFRLRHEIDTGDVLLRRATPIGPDETTGEVYARLMALGAEALLETVEGLAAGTLTPHPQADAEASHAPKIFREDCRLDWSAAAKTCHDRIRGLSPAPTAFALLGDQEIKLLRSRVVPGLSHATAGELLPLAGEHTADGAPGVGIACGDGGVVELAEVKPAGKRLMSGREWGNGLRLTGPLALR